MENRRKSIPNNKDKESNEKRRISQYSEDHDDARVPSHRCLIVDRSFEALKRAGSSTVEMHKYGKEITERVNSELHKGLEFQKEVNDGRTFLHKAENDSVLAMIREREEESTSGEAERIENTNEQCERSSGSSSELNGTQTKRTPQEIHSRNENTEHRMENVDSSKS